MGIYRIHLEKGPTEIGNLRFVHRKDAVCQVFILEKKSRGSIRFKRDDTGRVMTSQADLNMSVSENRRKVVFYNEDNQPLVEADLKPEGFFSLAETRTYQTKETSAA